MQSKLIRTIVCVLLAVLMSPASATLAQARRGAKTQTDRDRTISVENIVKIEGDKLQLGARSADGNMCREDKRPTALGQPVIRRTD
jgi:hypothetical protein